MNRPAKTPEPPYFAAIFTSRLAGEDPERYDETAARMLELATAQPGFLGVESARGEDGLGITVSYWRDEAAIAAWRAQAEHAEARRLGRDIWYRCFTLRVAKVERAMEFDRDDGSVGRR